MVVIFKTKLVCPLCRIVTLAGRTVRVIFSKVTHVSKLLVGTGC